MKKPELSHMSMEDMSTNGCQHTDISYFIEHNLRHNYITYVYYVTVVTVCNSQINSTSSYSVYYHAMANVHIFEG